MPNQIQNIMRKFISGALFALILQSAISGTATAQSIELLAGNTLNGAVNGVVMGASVMAVTNNPDFAPLRVGAGLGTLYGIGTGAFDISKSGGQKLLVTGSFNDGNNSSIIVLLDTFYGAAAGAVVATAVMLVADEPLVNGLQYGAGVGAWVGFGFGLFDAFVLAERITASDNVAAIKHSNSADGLIALNFEGGKSIGFLSPGLISTYNSDFSKELTATVQVVNFKLSF